MRLTLAASRKKGRSLFISRSPLWLVVAAGLGVGVGAATGYATLGMVGYEQRQDYAAIGPVINLAARLCSRAESGQILVPERLANLLQEVVSIDPIGPMDLRGFKASVNVYNVTGMRKAMETTKRY